MDRPAFEVREEVVRIDVRSLGRIEAAEVVRMAFEMAADAVDDADVPSDMEGDTVVYAALGRVSAALRATARAIPKNHSAE